MPLPSINGSSLAWSISLFSISLKESVNGTQFVNITFLFLLLWAVAALLFGTVIVPLTSMYASLYSHKP